jgi:hypothetical protein
VLDQDLDVGISGALCPSFSSKVFSPFFFLTVMVSTLAGSHLGVMHAGERVHVQLSVIAN